MLADVVALYRALDRPALDAGYSYVYDGALSEPGTQLAMHCEQLPPVFGVVDVLDQGNGRFRIEVQLPTNDQARVFHDVGDVLRQSPSIAFGLLPENYYIADIDYCSMELRKPVAVLQLEKLVRFIGLLSRLADDKVDVGSSGVNRLLFILPTDAAKVRKTALAEIKVEQRALGFELNHLDFLAALVADENADKLHVEERLLIMRSAIADTLAEGDDTNDLTYLVRKWPEIRRRYQVNFQAYIRNFAFEDVRKKIVDAELDYAAKLSNAFGDVAGKLWTLPVSIAGVVALDKLPGNAEFMAACIGLCLVTAVLLGVLLNVRQQIDRLQLGYEYVFGPVLGKARAYPVKLRGELEKRQESLASQARLTRLTLWFFIALAFLPAIGAAWKAWLRVPALMAGS
ncbi:hypothetical protein [Herbaspirillum sp. YR522]|uniref:hypothetical protein n=1 Tax=Herbaspirillum sp. YR522 TaxID=1144342 RepID=UPI00026FC4A0|nr:hypothetical protein [Herbaspirillum sp. YR522]EJN07615.1 hypothetical protein PMI40_01772 [Herbaspirillum sp. YR522]